MLIVWIISWQPVSRHGQICLPCSDMALCACQMRLLSLFVTVPALSKRSGEAECLARICALLPLALMKAGVHSLDQFWRACFCMLQLVNALLFSAQAGALGTLYDCCHLYFHAFSCFLPWIRKACLAKLQTIGHTGRGRQQRARLALFGHSQGGEGC